MGLLNSQAHEHQRARSRSRRDLLKATPDEMRDVRGKDVAMIFQDPFACLHPMYRVGDQIAEAVRAHAKVSKKLAGSTGGRAARRGRHPEAAGAHAGLPAPVLGRHAAASDDRDGAGAQPRPADRRRAHDGARRDGAGADPRAHRRVKREFDIGVILITHDLGVVAEMAHKVMVMYAGRAIETGPPDEIFRARITHTPGACSSRCRHAGVESRRLVAIEGRHRRSSPCHRVARSIPAAPPIRALRPDRPPLEPWRAVTSMHAT